MTSGFVSKVSDDYETAIGVIAVNGRATVVVTPALAPEP
jgi:hypothetical protein